MELLSSEFFSALLAIIIIDLVLAGDNAIVIALAARNLPPPLARRAILWGTAGAIAVRTAMTLIVVWLLKIPGLLLAGGAMLVWIAFKLLLPQAQGASGNGHAAAPANGFWGAMKTIIVADAVMGLDNVVAVAGAAHGSFLLVVLGLLISIPIVIWGSRLILGVVERYPAVVYVGSAVLAWTAAKMMVSEPLIQDLLADHPVLRWTAYAAVLGGVLGAGFLVNHSSVRERVARHLVDIVNLPAASARPGSTSKVLVPVDGSEHTLHALRLLTNRFHGRPGIELHLVHVRSPLKQHIAKHFRRRDLDLYHREEAERVMKQARSLLQRHGIPYVVHIELGDKGQMINEVARRIDANLIVIGTARKNSFTRFIEDSVTNQVLEQAKIPVEVISGYSTSPLEWASVRAVAALVFAWLVIDGYLM